MTSNVRKNLETYLVFEKLPFLKGIYNNKKEEHKEQQRQWFINS